jgi:hypothetical protein
MRIGLRVMPVVMALAVVGCAGLTPEAHPLPPEMAAFLDGDGAFFTVAQRPDGALDLPPTAATVKVRELDDTAGFRGIADAPIYGRLTCPAIDCPGWIPGPQPMAAWLVWFPTDRAFVLVDARTGVILRAAVKIPGPGEWSVVL